jgi:DNA-binding transcriptional regulator YhcF (GntR family)
MPPKLVEGKKSMYLDKQHPMPVYLQLKEMLQNQIEQGFYLSHQKLPSERDLCEHYDLSRMTARRALQELIAEGWAYTRAGKGTFVSHNSIGPPKNPQPGVEPAYLIKASYRENLVQQLLTFNPVGVEQIIAKLLALYPLEIVALKLFPEVIWQIEQKRRQNKISALAENYALTTLRSQLIAMVNATALSTQAGPKILLACDPEDQHEIWLLLLALSLRRRGFLVIYLGAKVVISEFCQVIDTVQPQLICFSVSTMQTLDQLLQISRICQASTYNTASEVGQQKPGPLLTFGGAAFRHSRTLLPAIAGLYVGDTVESAVAQIQQLLQPHQAL